MIKYYLKITLNFGYLLKMENLDLKYLYEQKIFTDINIIIRDQTNIFNLSLHKNVLYLSCDFFRILLTKYSEKEQNNITIDFDFADAIYDVILSFYKIESNVSNLIDWEHILKKIISIDYLCIVNFDYQNLFNKLNSLIIPKIGLELLLRVNNIFNNNNKICLDKIGKILCLDSNLKNYPNLLLENILLNEVDKYNITYFLYKKKKIIHDIWENTNFVSDISNVISSFCFSPDKKYQVLSVEKKVGDFSHKYHVELKDNINDHLSRILDITNSEIFSMIFSPNGSKFVYCYDSMTKILENFNLTHKIEIGRIDSSLSYLVDNQFAISVGCNIHIINDVNGKIIDKIIDAHLNLIWDMKFSSINQTLISGCKDGIIKIWDVKKNFVLLKMLNCNIGPIRTINIVSHYNFIICGGSSNIKIFDSSTGYSIVNEWKAHDKYIKKNLISSNQKEIISCSNDGKIKIWDIFSGNMIKTFDVIGEHDDHDWITDIEMCSYGNMDLIEKIKKII